MDSKTRSKLSALAQKIKPIFQIGKNGLTEVVIKELSQALEARELIKISVIKTSDVSAKELFDELATRLSAEQVSVIGSKIVLYRKSKKQGIKHILD